MFAGIADGWTGYVLDEHRYGRLAVWDPKGIFSGGIAFLEHPSVPPGVSVVSVCKSSTPRTN